MAKRKAAPRAKTAAKKAKKAAPKKAARKAAPKKAAARKPAPRKAGKPAKKAAKPVARRAGVNRKVAPKRRVTPKKVLKAAARKPAPASAKAKAGKLELPPRPAVRPAVRQMLRKAAPSAKPAAAKPTAKPANREGVERKAPSLNRARRVVVDDDIVLSPPSTLDMDRRPSAAKSGGRALHDRIERHHDTSPALTAGDVDADWESAESVGDEAAGGDNMTPDQDVVDEIGAALGVEYDDDEELQGGAEITERDAHRWDEDE